MVTTENLLVSLLDLNRRVAFEASLRSVAHALGTPMNVIQGHAELLSETGTGKSIEAIARQSQRMREHLDDALAFGERSRTTGAPVSVEQITQELLSLLADSDGFVSADVAPAQASQVEHYNCLGWLFGMVRYFKSRGATSVAIEARPGENQRLVWRLSAKGCSWPNDKLRPLLEPWYHGLANEPVGFDLAVALRIAQQAGAQLNIEPGDGSASVSAEWPLKATEAA